MAKHKNENLDSTLPLLGQALKVLDNSFNAHKAADNTQTSFTQDESILNDFIKRMRDNFNPEKPEKKQRAFFRLLRYADEHVEQADNVRLLTVNTDKVLEMSEAMAQVAYAFGAISQVLENSEEQKDAQADSVSVRPSLKKILKQRMQLQYGSESRMEEIKQESILAGIIYEMRRGMGQEGFDAFMRYATALPEYQQLIEHDESKAAKLARRSSGNSERQM